jgi:hypothetical protein
MEQATPDGTGGRRESMRTRTAALLLLIVGLALVLPAGVSATQPNNESATYEFVLELPNVAQASNGDTLALLGEGMFGVHPKSASGGGSFTYTAADGSSFDGTWTVNRLVAFQPYGCGVVFGTPLPPNFCGGRLVLDVTAQTPFGAVPSKVTVFCVIGSPPPGTEEGVRVVVPGVGNFNRQLEGMNTYFKQ